MRTITVSRQIPAPVSEVWAVLADFPNIADWNGGVKASRATSERIEGVGATRHCDLAPTGTLEETVREWRPAEKMVISIDSTTRLPIEAGLATFDLGGDESATNIVVTYAYDTKWGVFGKLLGGVLDRQLTKGFEGFVDDLASTATKSA